MDRPPDVKLATKGLVKPFSLGSGDRIQFCAPSYAAAPERIVEATAFFGQAGYRVGHSANLTQGYGYLAGPDATRLAELNAAFADPDLQMILSVRGGYGAMRLLDRLDWPALARHPKILAGFSDFTAILLAAYVKTGLVNFYGPMAAVEFTGPHAGFAWEGMQQAIAPTPLGPVPAPETTVFRPGQGAGRLLGGCLALLSPLAGTEYFPDLDGTILFWEEVGEPPYRIDRMLTQLRLGGHLSRLSGMVIGGLTDCQAEAGKASLTIEEVLRDVLDGTDFPVLMGLPFGHIPRPLTLPIGVQARIEADESGGRLIIEEAATRPREDQPLLPTP